jgi:hypothetical protein
MESSHNSDDEESDNEYEKNNSFRENKPSQNLQFVKTLNHEDMGSPNLQYINTIPIHNKEYEDAEIKIKIQEAHLKEAEIKLKLQEVELKKAQVIMKLEEANHKKQESLLKEKEITMKDIDTLLKEQDTLMKKHEVKMKWLESNRYEKETEHQQKINLSIQTSLILSNLQARLKIIHSIGLNFGSKTDFDTLVKMSELLGDSVPDNILDDLKAIKNKINKDNEAKNLYS